MTRYAVCTMHFGAHVSIAGGFANAPKNAADLGCEVFQFFSRSPRGGPAPAITNEGVRTFREACERHEQRAWYIHTPYYVNLASAKTTVRSATVRIIREELERGTMLGAEAIMTHLGSAKDVGEKEGTLLVLEGLRRILKGYTGTTMLLLEISAGSGLVVGDTFEELAIFLSSLRSKRVGICFDTQHAFASGYDLRTPAAVKKTFDAFDRIIGLEQLKLSHCNDSKPTLGSHVDRHDHLGKGEIGIEGFRAIVREPRLKKLNLILETPTEEGMKKDLAFLKKLRSASRA